MKKIIAFVISFTMLIVPFVMPTGAADDKKTVFDDGSFIIEAIDEDAFADEELDSEEEDSFFDIISAIKRLFRKILELIFGKKETPKEPEQEKISTVNKTKYASYYDKNGTLLWTVYLQGSFSYDGETSKCLNSKVYSKCNDSDWSVTSAAGYKEGSTATGKFTVQQYKLGVKLKTVERTLTLTCDKNGKVY